MMLAFNAGFVMLDCKKNKTQSGMVLKKYILAENFSCFLRY